MEECIPDSRNSHSPLEIYTPAGRGGGGTFERQAGLGGALTAEEQAPRLQGGGRRGVLLFHTKLPQLRQLLQEEKREEEEEEDPGDD